MAAAIGGFPRAGNQRGARRGIGVQVSSARLLRPRPAKLNCSSWNLIGQLASGGWSVSPV